MHEQKQTEGPMFSHQCGQCGNAVPTCYIGKMYLCAECLAEAYSHVRDEAKAALARMDLHTRRQQLRELRKALKVERLKLNRNDPCGCGSGKKYKKCCGLSRSATTNQRRNQHDRKREGTEGEEDEGTEGEEDEPGEIGANTP